MEEYQNRTNRPSYAGSCGHAVGSRAYLNYMESKVFGATVSGFFTPDYERLLKDALKSIADQLERDLDYGIGKCEMKCTCTKSPSSIRIKFTIDDKYNFDHIRTIRGDVERFIAVEFELGNLANDAGLISQADGVISTYYSYIRFKKIITLN